MHIGSSDFRACLDAVHAIASAGAGLDDFARAGAASLGRLVSGDVTLSIRARNASGRRPGDGVIPVDDEGRGHGIAVPIHADEKTLVSFVFSRCRDFDARELRRLELIRQHLGDLYRLARAVDEARAAWGVPRPDVAPSPDPALTPRESEVLDWLGGGKTDRDIATILGISPRTVHKHLQRIYEKLGVETRTAAVVRAMRMRRDPGRGEPARGQAQAHATWPALRLSLTPPR